MTQIQLRRLEKLERFVERLQLNSRIAKAAGSDGGEEARVLGVTPSGDLKKLESRIAHLEEIATLVTRRGGAADGELLLKKAVSVYDAPDTLMAAGERSIHDPTHMGIFASHLSSGDLTAARQMLTEVGERSQLAKAADLAADVAATLPGTDDGPAHAELLEHFGQLERQFARVSARLDQLEQRPQAAPVRPGEQVVVKAANTGKKRRLTHEEESNHLLSMLDRYVDSPTTAGQISSMIQQGKHAEVRPILERAKQAHETAKIREERRQWGN